MRLIDRPVVRVRSSLIEDLACYSKACAPPPVGKGGSGDGGGGSAPSSSSGEWRPNVSRSTFGADRVPRDTGEIMKKAFAEDMGNGGPRGNDHSLSAIYDARGFNKRPEEMDKEDFEEFIKGDDVLEMWRGVDTGRAQYADIGLSYHENDIHWTGRGVFGNGTYFAAHDGTNDGAAVDARREAIGYGGADPVLIRGAMRDDNLARYSDLVGVSLAISKMTTPSLDDPRKPAESVRDLDPEGLMVSASQGRMRDAWEQHATRQTTAMAMEIVSQGLDAGMTLSQIRRVTDDHGRIAALIGYDGIQSAPYGGGAAVYTVVLNRGATVVEENLYRPHMNDANGEPSTKVRVDRDWTARRGELASMQASAAEELACYDASCRPPTSGGTGGSSKRRVGGQIGLNADGSIPADAGKVMVAAIRGIQEYNEQDMQRQMYEARGYNARGTVLSREEFNDAVDEGKFEEGWRGIDGPRWGPVERMQRSAAYNKAERDQARDIIDGETHYPGRGILGNGTYVALGPNTVDARRAAQGYGDNLIRIGLPESITKNTFEEMDTVSRYIPDIIDDGAKTSLKESRWDDGDGTEPHDQAMHDAAFATALSLVKAGRDAGLQDDTIIIGLGDVGRVATVLGVDGYVERSSGGEVKYVVALNRGAMTFESTVYDHTGIVPRHKP